MKRSPLKRAGRKTKQWEKERAKLKVRFLVMGITRCELRLRGCWGDNSLGFAHARKRRNLKPHELGECVLACGPCHDQIEALPESEMAATVRGIIAKRA